MLTAVLLCCALLLALPTMQGAQMGLAPLEGIRRPDQAPLPELPGQCGQGWVCVGLDTFWSQIILPGMHPPSPFPIPGLGGGCFAHGRVLLSHHLLQAWD